MFEDAKIPGLILSLFFLFILDLFQQIILQIVLFPPYRCIVFIKWFAIQVVFEAWIIQLDFRTWIPFIFEILQMKNRATDVKVSFDWSKINQV